MSESVYLYYFACQTLLFALSLHDFMYDDLASDDVDQRLDQLLANNLIVGWLADEIELVLYGEENEGGRITIKHTSIETLGDSLVFDWNNKLKNVADSVSALYPTFDQKLLLFDCYSIFLAKLLQEFQSLMGLLPLRESEFYPRYISLYSEFDRMIKIALDQVTADFQKFADDSTENSLINIVEQKIASLILSWQQSIYSAVAAETTP